MSNIKVKTKDIPFVYTKGANINAAYGPWNSLEAAIAAAEEIYKSIDPITGTEVVSIPIGLTVGVFANLTLKEYWYNGETFNEKLAGKSEYLLVFLYNGIQVDFITLNMDLITINRIQAGTQVYTGTLKYKKDNAQDWTNVPSTNSISLTDVRNSIEVKWEDSSNELCKKSAVVLSTTEMKFLKFYAYTQTAPSINSANYLSDDWNPGESWTKERQSLSIENPKEWGFERYKYNNVWQPYTGPTITGLRGSDGMSVYGKEFIYVCSDLYSSDLIDDLSDEIGEINLTSGLPDDAENGIYFDPNAEDEHGNKKHPLTTVEHIWYTKLPAISIDNRYIFASERTKDGDSVEFSAWTEPVLVYNFSIGLDGAFTEYLFCNFPNEVLYGSTEWNNICSDIDKINSSSYVTNLDLEIAGKPFDSNISALGLTYIWNLNAKGVSDTNKYEYCIYRKVSCDKFGIKNFEEIPKSPIIWSAFGKEGNDGKGIEYIYILTSTSTPPTIFQLNSTGFDPATETDWSGKHWHDDEFVPYTDSNKTTRWYDNPQEVTHEYLYLWAAHRKGSEGDWDEFSEPVIWNKYHANYEIFLSNDNATIPASKEGVYTMEAARVATRTEVIVKLGNEEIDYTDSNNGITVVCNDYEQVLTGSKIWQLKNPSITLNDGTYLGLFKVYLNSDLTKVIANKSQSVHLNKSGDTFKLFVTPNSRQWYGGTNYSATEFEASIYKIDAGGQMGALSDIGNFKIVVQSAGSSLYKEFTTLHLDLSDFTTATDHDLYVTLVDANGKVVDKEVIDTINLAGLINPEEVDAIRIALSNDSPTIPDESKSDDTTIQTYSAVRVSAYSARNIVEIASITASLAYTSGDTLNIEPVITSTSTTIKTVAIQFTSGNTDPLKSDVLVNLTVTVLHTDPSTSETVSVTYDKSYTIKLLSPELPYYTFEVYPNIISTSEGNTEFDVDELNFVILERGIAITPDINYTFTNGEYPLSGKLKFSTTINKYEWFDANDTKLTNGLKTFSPTNVSNFGSSLHSFQFNLAEQLKYQSVEVFYQKYTTSDTYDVNLTNSYVAIQKGTTGNTLEDLITTLKSIYKGSESITPSSTSYKLDGGSALNWSALLTAVSGIVNTLGIHHITYCFTITIDSSTTPPKTIELLKTQTIEIVDRATYKLLYSPTSIVKQLTNRKEKITITVNKYSNSQVTAIGGHDLSASDLYIFINNTKVDPSSIDLYNQIEYSYGVDETSVTLELKNELSSNVYRTEDFETIAIVTEGAKGDTPIQLFKWSATVPSTPTVTALDWSGAGPFDGWYKYVPTRTTGSLYMSQNILQGNGTLASNWSTPVSISGNDGDPGADADNIEWIYNYSSSDYDANVGEVNPSGAAGTSSDNKNQNGWVPHNWYNHALAVSNVNPTVYASYRKITGTSASKTYGAFNEPIVWSHWGLNGIDGDGVLYVYKLYASILSSTQEENYKPIRGNQKSSGEWEANNSLDDQTGTWLDNAPSTTSETPYCYCSVIKRTNGVWGLFETLSLWSKWSRDGQDGVDGQDGQDGKDGVTIRTFKGTFEEPANIVFRNDSELTGTKKKWDATNQTWVNDTDPVLYKDYYLDITDDEHKVAYVCKLTYVVKPHTISDVDYIGYSTEKDEHDNLISVRFEDVWDVTPDLGNAFFTSLYALSGNIELLSSSVLKVNGRLLMQGDDGHGGYEVIGGINGEEGNDQTVVDSTLAFWSGGTGQMRNGVIDANFYVTKDGFINGKGIFNSKQVIFDNLNNKNIAYSIDPRRISLKENNEILIDIPLNFNQFGNDNFINIEFGNAKIGSFQIWDNQTVNIYNRDAIVDLPHCAFIDFLDNSSAFTFTILHLIGAVSPSLSGNLPTTVRWYSENNYGDLTTTQSAAPYKPLRDLLLKRWLLARTYIGKEIIVRGNCTLLGAMTQEGYQLFLYLLQHIDETGYLVVDNIWYLLTYFLNFGVDGLYAEPKQYLEDDHTFDLNFRCGTHSKLDKTAYVYKFKCVTHTWTNGTESVPFVFWVLTEKTEYPNTWDNESITPSGYDPFAQIEFTPEENLSES